MIQKDAGVLQLESFSPENEKFLALELKEQVDCQLSHLASVSGSSYAKLLAAVMLKEQFQPGGRIQEGEVLADTIGYERLNEPLFMRIAAFYERMLGCVDFSPVASVCSSREKAVLYDAEAHVRQAEGWKEETENSEDLESRKEESGNFWLQIPAEEEWQGILPVICVKTGTVTEAGEWENGKSVLCLELEEGVRINYGNLADYLKDWQPGDVIKGGEILGSAAGLVVQFQLQMENGTWHSFNGLPGLFHGEKQVRSVTQMLQSEYHESHSDR